MRNTKFNLAGLIWALGGGFWLGAGSPADAAPTITRQPTNQSVLAGGNATFSVAAQGIAPLHYQWLFINGDTGAVLPVGA